MTKATETRSKIRRDMQALLVTRDRLSIGHIAPDIAQCLVCCCIDHVMYQKAALNRVVILSRAKCKESDRIGRKIFILISRHFILCDAKTFSYNSEAPYRRGVEI